jgi:phosphoribosylanthranilate isomerase
MMNGELKVKVCGMREADNIRAVEALGIDWMGFIFWPKSKRYVSKFPEYMPVHAKRVGVFVDEDIEQVKRIAEDYALDIIQLHGHESPDYVRSFNAQASTLDPRLSSLNPQPSALNSKPSIIKAFNIATAADLEATKPYEGIVDYFLFDTRCPLCGDIVAAPHLEAAAPRPSIDTLPLGASTLSPGIDALPGGTGQQFDWSILSAYDGSTPYLLSGGIGPGDAESGKDFLASCPSPLTSKCIGIDLNSRFETVPALKDINKLRAFIKEIRL